MRRVLRENGLSIAMFGLFFLFLAGQSITGYRTYNQEQQEQQEHREPQMGLVEYLGTGHFVEAVFENWESEFLQMGFYVLLTAFLYQKGSAESKQLDDSDPVNEDPRDARGRQGVPGLVGRGGRHSGCTSTPSQSRYWGCFCCLSFCMP